MEEKNYLFSAPTLILLSIGIIALLGFAFLAFEGGRIYMERYQAQNAAYEAASAMCAGGNDLTKLPSGLAVPYGIKSDGDAVVVNHPPTSGINAGNMDYIEVVVSRLVSGGLINLVDVDQFNVTGQASVFCGENSLTISSAVFVRD